MLINNRWIDEWTIREWTLNIFEKRIHLTHINSILKLNDKYNTST